MWKLPKFIAKIFADTPDVHSRIVWWVVWLPFIGVPAVIGWLSSNLPWFWHWFGLAGVAIVMLVSAAFVMVIMAAYRHYRTPAPDHDGKSAWHAPFIDEETASLAGTIQHLGEIVARPGFIVFGEMTVDAQHFLDVMRSTHIIWTNKRALQLRRDFAHEISVIGDANKSRDSEERHEYLGKLDATISSLVTILLGQSPP